MEQIQLTKALCIGALFSVSAHMAMAETRAHVPISTPKFFSGFATATQDRICAEVFAGLSVAGAKGIDPTVSPDRYNTSMGMAIGSGLLLKGSASIDKDQLAVAHDAAMNIASQNDESVFDVVVFCSVRLNTLIGATQLASDEAMKAVELFGGLVDEVPISH